MNAVLPEIWAERLHRLAVGFEPLDPVAGGRVPHPVRFEVEGPPPRPPTRSGPYRMAAREGQLRAVVDRHDSSLFALLYQPRLEGETVDLRVYDLSRRRVARRFRVPILPPGSLAGGEPAALTRARRTRRPALFPGAAYDTGSRITGLRGRVLRGGAPLRWARVEARLEPGGALVGRAHGDDRGEFLLVLTPDASPPAELTDPLEARVTVFGPAVAPVPVPATLAAGDPLWDLPLEPLPAPGDPDPVSSGEALPAGYVATATSTRIVPFRLGRLISAPDFVFA
jgi:hypothetical protein